MSVVKTNVGPNYGGTGTSTEALRSGTTGALAVTDAHGHFWEALRLGLTATGVGIYSATTAAAGVAPGTALSTTPPLAIWNPPNSGVIVNLLKTRLGYVSGTLGAGTIVYGYVSNQTSVPTTGTALTANPNLVGLTNTPRAKPYQGSTLAATPTLLAPVYTLTAMLATTATSNWATSDLIDSEIGITPGGVFIMQGITAAGTSPLVLLGASWEEVPYLL